MTSERIWTERNSCSSEAKTSAQKIQEEFQTFLAQINFPSELITQFGAVCLDVGDGTEIEMLRPHKPIKIVVSEPSWEGYLNLPYYSRQKEKQRILSLLKKSQGLNVILRRQQADGVLSWLAKIDSFRVALITRLNIWPEFLEDDHLRRDSFWTNNFQLVRKILIPGGLMIVSVLEPYYGKILERMSRDEIEGFSLTIIKYTGSWTQIPNLGSVFLMGKKWENNIL